MTPLYIAICANFIRLILHDYHKSRGERFRDGQYSLVSFLFAVLLLTVHPCAQPFVTVGTRAPPCPMESAPLSTTLCPVLFQAL